MTARTNTYPAYRTASRRGVTVGKAGQAISTIPAEAYGDLEARAARTGKTLAQVLADHWTETHA